MKLFQEQLILLIKQTQKQLILFKKQTDINMHKSSFKHSKKYMIAFKKH